ncbi:hypothetical protein [Virgibacillus ainsalahensis]
MSKATDLLVGRVIAVPGLFDGMSDRSLKILEDSLLVKLAVFIIDGGGMLLAAMLIFISEQNITLASTRVMFCLSYCSSNRQDFKAIFYAA